MNRTSLAFTSVLLTINASACTADVAPEVEPTSVSSDAIHGTAAKDTRFPAVGYVSFKTPGWTGLCSGTLIGPRTVLVAAHCVAPVAKGCAKELLLSGGRFMLTPSGDRNDPAAVTYEIDDIRVNQHAYAPKLFDCGDGARCTDLSGAISDEAAAFGAGLQTTSDIALLRIKTDTTLRPPSSVVATMDVITSVSGGVSNAVGAVRPQIDVSRRFGANHANMGASPNIVGFGFADDSNPWRRSGTGWFTYDNDWARVAETVYSCTNPKPTNGSVPDGTGLKGTEGIRIRRTGYWDAARSTWVNNGVTIAPGDSGSPLVVIGGSGPGQVPELPAGRSYVLGVASRGDQTPPNMTVPTTNAPVAQFAATFKSENAFLIEWTLNEWAGSWTQRLTVDRGDCRFCKFL